MISDTEREAYSDLCDTSHEDLETEFFLASLTAQEAEDLGL
jgi:hypothetical protein